jgi:cyanate permease
MLLPMSITSLAVSALTGRRAAVRGRLIVGSLLQVAVCVGLLTFTDGTPLWMIVGLSVLLGIPNGLLNLANQNALYFQADPDRIGASSGLFRTFGYLGAIVASLGNGTFLADRADTTGLHHLATFLLVVSGVFVVVTLVDRSLRRVVPAGGDVRLVGGATEV